MVLFLTVVAVSLDAYLAGLAYSLKRRLSAAETAYTASFTFFVCALALELNRAFIGSLPLVKETGACIFVFLGAKNYLGMFEKRPLLPRARTNELWLLGLAVAADAGLASLTLYVPSDAHVIPYAFYMFAAHFLFLFSGTVTVRLSRVMERLSGYSGIALIALGLMKLAV